MEHMQKPLILLIDDDDSLRRIIEFTLLEEGYLVKAARSGEEGISLFERHFFDAVLTDITMPGMNGIEVLKELHGRDRTLPIIVITAYGTIESAVMAMKQGAFDYVTKPFNRDELLHSLNTALKMRRIERENEELRAEIKDKYRFDGIVGISEKIKTVLDIAGRVARTDATVLIVGESGTGKELIAKGIHFNSTRGDGRFVAVNCAALPEHLVESELFGHVKGSFTGAMKDKPGKFEVADGGTLFLDEISELRIDLQAKILRALQEREVDRVGGSEPKSVDVRIIASTNKNIEHEVKTGAFREDLYYRLSVLTLSIPPLRERRDDIPLLVAHFLKKYGTTPDVRVSEEAFSILMSYGWPGNVRELEGVIERASILRRDNVITPAELPERVLARRESIEQIVLNLPEDGLSLESLEKNLIARALDKFKGNQTKAAEYLGITRPTLIYRIEKYGMK